MSTHSKCKKRKPKVDEEVYDYLHRHLTLYGNTVLNNNPKKYLERLRKDGLDVEARYIPGYSITDKWRNEIVKYEEMWILSVKKSS